MTVNPTLRCACNRCHLEQAFAYDEPPPGETAFELHGLSYYRCYERCTECGHWFGRHKLDLSKLYERDYVDATYGGSDGMRQKFEQIMALAPEKSDNAQRIRRIRDFAFKRGILEKQSPRLLDVGSGLGVFPAAMKDYGWQVTALETDARTIDHLKDNVGVTTLNQHLHQLDSATIRPFKVITFNKVLEHIQDPVALLAASKALLLQDGFIYVEVPDVAAADAGPGREEFFIEHHHVFSPASLSMMVANAGYRLLVMNRLREPSGKYTLFCMLAAVS